MKRCCGHTLLSGQALGMCIRCAALHPRAAEQIAVPRPDARGVWGCQGFVPLGEGA